MAKAKKVTRATKHAGLLGADADLLFLAAERLEARGDLVGAFHCLLGAACLGSPSAQLNLANAYANGEGVRKSLAKAAYWYNRAYLNGNFAAARNMGIDKLRSGNTRSAISWLKKGMEGKDGGSYVLLAGIYAKQRGGKGKAVEVLKRLARLDRNFASQLDHENGRALLAKLKAS